MTKPVEALNALWQFSSALVEKHGMNGSNMLSDAEHQQWQEIAGLCHEALATAASDSSTSAAAFLQNVADLKIWDYDKDDGVPYEECEEPAEGYLDSHCCLMSLIEEARSICQETPSD